MVSLLNLVSVIGNITLLILICFTVYLTFRCVRDNKVVNIVATALKKGEKLRRESEEEYAVMYGNKDKQNLLYKFDLMLEQSGIKSWSKHITTEAVGVIICISALLTFITSMYITASWLIGLACMVLVIFFFFIGINILIDIRYEQINQSMIQMFDVFENNSMITDDLITIIGNSYEYLPEPLRSCLKRCYEEAIITGDKVSAFRKAELSSPHEKLRDFLRNMEMCSRHTCNYQEIIRDSRNTFKVYLAGKDERRNMVYSEGMDLVMIISVCALFLVMIFKKQNIDIVHMLIDTVFGHMMLVYWAASLGYGIYAIVKASRR